MSKILKKLTSTLKKTLNSVFPEPIEITIVIVSVDVEKHAFVGKTRDSDTYNKTIFCKTDKDVSKLKRNDVVKLTGTLKIDDSSATVIYLNVDTFYLYSERQLYKGFLKTYGQLTKILKGEHADRIKRIEPKKPPQTINTIALVVMQSQNSRELENFKISFQEKCLGKVLIYHLNSELGSMEKALKFFQKYHYVDLICLLTNQLNINEIKSLSTINCVKFMLTRKEYPYILSIIDADKEMPPLSAILSNKCVDNINQCTDLIHHIQFTNKNVIQKKIEFGMTKLNQILLVEKNKIDEWESVFANALGMSFKNNVSNPNKQNYVKTLINTKLDQELHKMSDILNKIMTNIIDDPRLQYYFPLVEQSEKNILSNKMFNQKNFNLSDFSEKIENNNTNINNGDDILDIYDQFHGN